jgi:hypothetical protein
VSSYELAKSLALGPTSPQRLLVQVGDAHPFCRRQAGARHHLRSGRCSRAPARVPVVPRRSSAGPEALPRRQPGRRVRSASSAAAPPPEGDSEAASGRGLSIESYARLQKELAAWFRGRPVDQGSLSVHHIFAYGASQPSSSATRASWYASCIGGCRGRGRSRSSCRGGNTALLRLETAIFRT